MNVSRKILPPPLPATILHRTRLTHALGKALNASDAAFSYHLVLLCAPAGYGKTTLLVDTLEQVPVACCWYSLDHADLDTGVFLQTLLTSIRQRFPHFGAQLGRSVTVEDGTVSYPFLDTLITALETDLSEHCILVLYNYQAVNSNTAINEVVNYLLKNLPPQCLLVIESRSLPDLELAPLIAGRKMFGLGGSDLQFSAQDLYDLAQVQGLLEFSEEEATYLATTFDGWITGIFLSSRFGSVQFGRLSFPSGNNQLVSAYANSQLFAFITQGIFRHEAAIYTFLKETFLLETLTPVFCDALLETSNAAALLEYAESHGLFLWRMSEQREPMYRCHPTLRQVFQEEMRCHEPERYCMLYQRSAKLYYQMHEYVKALNYSLEVQEHELVARILLEASQVLFDQGQSELILRCLDMLPSHFTQQNPRFLLILLNIYLRRRDIANARLSLERIDAAFQVLSPVSTETDSEHILICAEFAIARGKLFLDQGDYQLANQYFLNVLEWAPKDERRLHTLAHQQLGICLILSGEPVQKGIAQFLQALHLCHLQRDHRLIGELHHQLANAYEWVGNYTVAEHHRQWIRTSQDDSHQLQRVINNLTGMGLLKMRQGLEAEAEAFFQHILRLTQQSPRFLGSKAYALLGFGELELTRQHFRQALMHLEDALSLARQMEDRYLLNDTLCTMALVYIRMDECDTARCLLDQILLNASETRSYERITSLLARGTLLLAQQCYDEARIMLEEVTDLTIRAGIQWLCIQAFMRLAACWIEIKQPVQAKKVLRQVISLNIRGDHDYVLQVELQAYPQLQAIIQEIHTQGESLDLQVLPRERLRIHALGEPSVFIDTIPVTRWRMARAMELYFFLLENNQPLRKDQIIAALWPEADDAERLNRTFRSTVFYLRQIVGEGCLLQRSGLYLLDLRSVYGEFWYDVAVFEEQQGLARAALEEEEDKSASQALQKMVELYRGDYVQAFYSDWCIPRRDELRRALMEAHRQLALIAWRGDAWDKSLHHWQHLLTLDPCLESAHYGVMRCYQRQGKRDLALRQYQRCSQELDQQLKTRPGPTLQKLYQRLQTLK